MSDDVKVLDLLYTVHAPCALYASILWAHLSTLLLLKSLMPSNADTSLKISLIMSLLSSPCMNYSIRFLSYSLYYILLPLCATCPSITGQIYGFSLVFWFWFGFVT